MVTDRSRCLAIDRPHGARSRESAVFDSSRNRRLANPTEAPEALSAKNFFVAKNPIRSPCDTPPTDFRTFADVHRVTIVNIASDKKRYSAALFSHLFEIEAGVSRQSLASARAHFVVASLIARRARTARAVNTSLSGKLFFLVRWCIRDAVHLDSRVHAAIKAISRHRRATWRRKLRRQRRRRAQ
jgi:hypothetical protein